MTAVGTAPPTRTAGRRVLAGITAGVGLLLAVAAAMHCASVVQVAYTQRGGYDTRLGILLFVGWMSLACGSVVLGATPAVARGSRRALRLAATASGVFGVGAAVLAPVEAGVGYGVAIFGGYAVAGWVAAARGTGDRS